MDLLFSGQRDWFRWYWLRKCVPSRHTDSANLPAVACALCPQSVRISLLLNSLCILTGRLLFLFNNSHYTVRIIDWRSRFVRVLLFPSGREQLAVQEMDQIIRRRSCRDCKECGRNAACSKKMVAFLYFSVEVDIDIVILQRFRWKSR